MYDIKEHARCEKRSTKILTKKQIDKNVDDVAHNVNKSDDKFISSYDNKINNDNVSQGVHPEITGVTEDNYVWPRPR